MVCIEEIVGDNLIIVVRSMRESAAAIAVTQGPNAGHTGLQLIVNHDIAALVSGNPGFVEIQIARVGDTSYGQKNVSTHYIRCTVRAIYVHSNTAIMLCQRYTFRIQ